MEKIYFAIPLLHIHMYIMSNMNSLNTILKKLYYIHFPRLLIQKKHSDQKISMVQKKVYI